MPLITWTYSSTMTPAPVTGVVELPGGVDSGSELPAEGSVVVGSRSWLLVNKDGGTAILPGEMDILLEDGHVHELTEPSLILDQRLRKAVSELRGSNPFAPNWGTQFRTLLGEKIFTNGVLKEIGKYLRELVTTLLDLQNETLRRIKLADAELVDRVDRIDVVAEASEIKVRMVVVTRAAVAKEVSVSI